MSTQNSTTVVLRKRKRRSTSDNLVLWHLRTSPSPGYELSESDYNPSSDHSAAIPQAPAASSSKTPPRNVDKRYKCTFEGCTKAYTKPTRLIEHERSHTGDRPFVCTTCQKSYFRESHLQAHARSHLPQSARPLVCEESGCQKRFWTSQHLCAHIELHKGTKPFKCSEPSCDAAFLKHHQLRQHICTIHAPPGTKPYRCEHTGCTKSFATNQKLRAHVKTHNDKRYVCTHASCAPISGAPATYHPTWSALQHHIRVAHPPTCPHVSCNAKSFATPHGLRAHLKLHAQRDMEVEMRITANSSDEDEHGPRKRRRGGELGREWVCEVEGCGKDFKSKKALKTHNNVSHLGRRDFVCQEAGCGRTFGYKHLLQRHFGKIHAPAPDTSSESESEAQNDDMDTTEQSGDETQEEAPSTALNIDFITGNSYAAHSREKMKNVNVLKCPHPSLPALLTGSSSPSTPSTTSSITDSNIMNATKVALPCQYVFSRAYDLRRHLRAEHGVEVTREDADRWVRKAKAQKASSTYT